MAEDINIQQQMINNYTIKWVISVLFWIILV